MVNIKEYLSKKKALVEQALDKLVPSHTGPFAHHIESIRYSLFVGGKRLRPILCLAACGAIDDSKTTEENLLAVACSLECIHTYSLIHDDLPPMDNDDLRRGKPTNHIVFGEAEAILAGDSLLTLAFELLSNKENTSLSAETQLKITEIIARSAGPYGMAGGQALDIAYENKEFPFETLQTIHKNKTGALITCSIHAGALGAGATEDQCKKLIQYGNSIGLGFQIVDDLLDVTSTTEKLGKQAGSDEKVGKATYPAYFGIEKSRSKAKDAIETALDAIASFDQKAEPLRAIANYIYTRSH